MSGKPLGVPVCGNCCRDGTGCDGCAKCLPRYLCVHADVTLGPYFECPEDPDDPYFVCCPTLDFRIGGGCPEPLDPDDGDGSGLIPDPPGAGNPGWAGSGVCHEACVFNSTEIFGTIVDVGLSVDIRIIKINGQCYTRVWSSTIMEEPIFFPGVLGWIEDPYTPVNNCERHPESEQEIRFSGTDLRGTHFDVVIRKPDVFVNPRSFDKCSECSCATCLPKHICVSMLTNLIASTLLNGPSLVFSCSYDPAEPDRVRWTPQGGQKFIVEQDYGPPIEYDIDLYLPTEKEAIEDPTLRAGAIIGRISGGDIHTDTVDEHGYPISLPYYDFKLGGEQILRQPGFPELPIDSVKCREPNNQWDSLNRTGGAAPFNFPVYRTNSIIHQVIPVTGGYDLIVNDAACGGLCRLVQNICYHPCCPTDQSPNVLHVTMTGAFSASFSMARDYSTGFLLYRGNEPAEYGNIGADWGLICQPIPVNIGWQWLLASGTRRIAESAITASCDPFELIFDSYSLNWHAEVTA